MSLLLGASIALLSGCASTRQLVPLPDQTKSVEDVSKARIYVVRPTSFGGAVSMAVLDGETKIGDTGPNGYLCWERTPGDTEIQSKSENTAKLPLKCEAGAVYYIKQHVIMGVMIARTKLSLLTDAEGKERVLKCKPPKVK